MHLIKCSTVYYTSAPHFTFKFCDSITALVPHIVHLFGHLAGNWIGVSMCCNTRWSLPTIFLLCLGVKCVKRLQKKNNILFIDICSSSVKIKSSQAILHHFNIKGKRVKRPALEKKGSYALIFCMSYHAAAISLQGRTEDVAMIEIKKRQKQVVSLSVAYVNILFGTFAI